MASGFLFGAACLLSSCSSYVGGRVEGVLLEAMPRVIGPAERYEATVSGANGDASHFDEVHAVGARVRRSLMPVIDRFEIDLQDVSVDRSNRQVTGVGRAHATVRVKSSDLKVYLQRQDWITQPRLALAPPDRIEIGGFLRVPGADIVAGSPATFTGRLIPSGSRLVVVLDSLKWGDREAPALLRGAVATAVNPLFDFSSYAVPSTIDRVDVQADAIVLEASGSKIRPVRGIN